MKAAPKPNPLLLSNTVSNIKAANFVTSGILTRPLLVDCSEVDFTESFEFDNVLPIKIFGDSFDSRHLAMMEAFGAGAGFLMLLWMLFCGVYAILIFFIPFILYAIMKNTKRTADLLNQMNSLQQTSPGSTSIRSLTRPAVPLKTLGSPLVEKPATTSSNKMPDHPTGKSLKFTGLKLASTCNETDEDTAP